MNFNCYNNTLRFKHPFAIAAVTRTTTEALFVELTQDGITGYGSNCKWMFETKSVVITIQIHA